MHRALVPMLMVVMLAGCTVRGVDVEQEQASGLAGELLDGHTFGQTLTLRHDGLYRIDLYTATYARENTQPVIFRVKDGPGTGEELVRMELRAAQISNSGPTIVTFPPLPDTAGRPLYFSVESPGSVPGDAISIYYSETDLYPGGQMLVDGQPTGGDIAFIAYTQEGFTMIDIWDDFYARARLDGAFWTVNCLVVALLLLAAFAAIWLRHRLVANGVDQRASALDDPSGPGSGNRR